MMHVMLPPRWRHRLLAAHIAAGAGMLGTGVVLLGRNASGADAALTVLIAHLALLAAVVLAFTRIWRRGSGTVSQDRPDPAPRHGSPAEE